MTTVYISIGNSDDELTQKEWSDFVMHIGAEVVSLAARIHGAWFSNPVVPWQNACWCLEFTSEAAEATAKDVCAELAGRFRQESIAWAVAPSTEFIRRPA